MLSKGPRVCHDCPPFPRIFSGRNAFRRVPDIRPAAMQRTDHDRMPPCKHFLDARKQNQNRCVALRTLAGARGPTAILAASAHGQADTSATSPFEPALCDLVHPRAHLVVGVGELASDLANPNGATTRLGLRQISLHAMNDLDMPKDSQPPSRHRFYIGSAAIFWFVVALGIWLRLFFKPPIFKNDDVWWAGWSLASYASVPAFVMALLAVFIRNQSKTNVPAWLITPPVFLFIIYMQLEWKRF